MRTTTTTTKAQTMAELRAAVLAHFKVANAKALRASGEFQVLTAGAEVDLRTRRGWAELYKQFCGVPMEERAQVGRTCINGIDVLRHFRPWHIFNLNPNTATRADVKAAYRRLMKAHHPDKGGDARVAARLRTMRDSMLAFARVVEVRKPEAPIEVAAPKPTTPKLLMGGAVIGLLPAAAEGVRSEEAIAIKVVPVLAHERTWAVMQACIAGEDPLAGVVAGIGTRRMRVRRPLWQRIEAMKRLVMQCPRWA